LLFSGLAKTGAYNGAPRRNQHYPTLFDNPEYQLMSREYSNVPMSLAYAPIGLPVPQTSTVPHSNHTQQSQPPHVYNQVTAANKGHNSANPPLNNNAHLPVRPGSLVGRHGSRSEEESEHEYYNELDKLKREMQPLQSARKNETTV
jgi:hypothetical protein